MLPPGPDLTQISRTIVPEASSLAESSSCFPTLLYYEFMGYLHIVVIVVWITMIIIVIKVWITMVIKVFKLTGSHTGLRQNTKMFKSTLFLNKKVAAQSNQP